MRSLLKTTEISCLCFIEQNGFVINSYANRCKITMNGPSVSLYKQDTRKLLLNFPRSISAELQQLTWIYENKWMPKVISKVLI